MNKTQTINMAKVPDRWLKLMLHLQNAVPGVFQLIFPDVEAARKANRRISSVVERHPSWFPMVVCQRDCCVYVIKTQYVQKVVIRDE